MFEFLKRRPKKENKILLEEVPLEEMESWLAGQLSKLEFQEEAGEFINQVKDHKWILGEKILVLEEAGISEDDNQRIEEKIKNVVIGHKSNYIKEMNRFVENLAVPDSPELLEVISFSSQLDRSLDELSHKTQKNYQAAQYLFFQSVEEVFKVVSTINALTKGFNSKLEKSNLHKLIELKNRLLLLQEKKKIKSALEENLSSREERLKKYLEQRSKHQAEKEKIKASTVFDEFNSLKEKESSVKKLVEGNKNDVFRFFFNLERALRKYEKTAADQKLVKSYLEDPANTFFNDSGLKVLSLFECMEQKIKSGEISLDDRQREIVLEQINKAKSGYLRSLMDKRKEVLAKWEEVRSKLKRYTLDEQMEELDYKLEHFQQQIEALQKEKEDLKSKLEVLDKKKLEEETIGLVKEILGRDIKIM